ncbi:hypothetical protein Ahy_A02g007825 [Arachis hypogaea]|uniref:Protein FAR1-RELATED SEQUENCE n=1 Tax=Arachis hypogaea TaxID=3818 RepID=A0A445EE03_ARAHY|nr:hypothetical protein Ahy_A02g007825 [Arachis hypogaea]
MEIENISDREEKPLSRIKLSRNNLYTRIEGYWCLNHFEGHVASVTSLLCKSSRDAQMELSMSMRRTIENNEEAGSRPSKTYQSFITAAGVTMNVKNYITRKVRNVSKLEDAKEFRKYLLKIKKKNQNFFFELELEVDQSIKIAFWADARSKATCEYFGDSFTKTVIYGFSLSRSPLLGRDEKHTKERKHACFFLTRSKEQRERERESDAADFHTVIPCTTKFSIEAQFQHVYTLEKFKKVQAQFKENVKCITRSKHSALGYTVYEVVEQIFNSTFNKSAVTYDTVAAQVKCQFLLFESRGILCRHVLSVLSFEQSKNVKRRHTHIKSSHDEPQLEPKSKIFDELVFRSQNIYEFASESEELAAILYRAYDNVMVEMQELKVKSKGACSLSHEDANLEAINELQSPPRVRTRGRPKNRSGSKMEKQIANASKKKKTKALSKIKLNLFYGGSVVQSNSSQYHGHVLNYQFRDSVVHDRFWGVN